MNSGTGGDPELKKLAIEAFNHLSQVKISAQGYKQVFGKQCESVRVSGNS